MNTIPFFKPLVSEHCIELINDTLALRNEITMEKRLEQDTCRYVGATYGVATTNHTAALHLSLSAMQLKRGDKIICSVNSFPSVAEVVRHFDAEPIFVDVDKDDFNVDVESFEKTLQESSHKKLKAAIINHVAGQCADLDPIYELAKKYQIKIIDNASCALGATYKGKKLGSLDSYITCFGYNHQTRNSLAGGGILISEDKELIERAKLLRNHAIVSDSWDGFGNLGYIYDVVDVGREYNVTELSAAFNVGRLAVVDQRTKRRQEIAAIYDRELADCPHLSIPVKKRDHIYTLYMIKIDKNRDNFAKELKENGIYTGLHYIPLHLLNYYKNKYSLRVNDFPNALINYQQVLSLPIYDSLDDEAVFKICNTIKKIARSRG